MRRKKRMNPLVYVVMSGLIFYFVVTFIQQQEEFSIIQAEMRALEHKIAKEEEKQEDLLEQQSKADTDAFIESIAREKLGMVKEGERLFVDAN